MIGSGRPTEEAVRPALVLVLAGYRCRLAQAVGIVGLVAYNWWAAVPFRPGLLRSSNGFFSDLEATGQPDAALLQHVDLLAGTLILAALLLRGRGGRDRRPRAEWPWLLVFSVAGALGAAFPYACTDGTSAACRRLEWHFRLPAHHYLHVAFGIVEFASVTAAALFARRRTSRSAAAEALVHRTVVRLWMFAYPALGAAYLADRFGAFVEPVFFLSFSALVAAELFEPVGPPGAEGGHRSRRMSGCRPAEA